MNNALLKKEAFGTVECTAQILAQNCSPLEICVLQIMADRLEGFFGQKYFLQGLSFAELKEAIKLAAND